MSLIDSLVEHHGIMKQPRGWAFGEFPEEPDDYFVIAPERGKGTKMAGAMIEHNLYQLLQHFLATCGDRYKDNQDITRAALHLFIAKVILPGITTQAKDRAKALAGMNRLKTFRKQTNDDKKMLDDCAELYSTAADDSERREPLEMLYAYIKGVLIPERQMELLDKAMAHPVFGEGIRAYHERMQARPTGLQDGENPVREEEDE